MKDDLQDKLEKLLEEIGSLKVQLQKKQQDAETLSNKILQMKEQMDFGSFKFVHVHMPIIIQKIAPKHKVPEPRELNLSADSAAMVASVPWASQECSDSNPCNANICPRCTLIHFKHLLDRLLAGYYSK